MSNELFIDFGTGHHFSLQWRGAYRWREYWDGGTVVIGGELLTWAPGATPQENTDICFHTGLTWWTLWRSGSSCPFKRKNTPKSRSVPNSPRFPIKTQLGEAMTKLYLQCYLTAKCTQSTSCFICWLLFVLLSKVAYGCFGKMHVLSVSVYSTKALSSKK